jgi:hypothetical protein
MINVSDYDIIIDNTNHKLQWKVPLALACPG